jgi:hypothetical protein
VFEWHDILRQYFDITVSKFCIFNSVIISACQITDSSFSKSLFNSLQKPKAKLEFVAVLILNWEILGSSLGPAVGYRTKFSLSFFSLHTRTVSFTSFPFYRLFCFSVLYALATSNAFKQTKQNTQYIKQGRPRLYNVTSWCVRATICAVEEQ